MAYITLSDGWSYGEMTEREITRINDKMERAANLAGVEYRYQTETDAFHTADDADDEIDWWNGCNWYNARAASIAKWLATKK